MGYIHSVQLDDNSIHRIQPTLFATAGGTSTALTAGISNFELAAGVYVNIKVSTVGANATLNVNNTGAKNIYYNGVQIGANMLSEDNIYTFIYTGTHWDIVGDITGKNIMVGTTAEWAAHNNYIAPGGTIIVYTDHGTYKDKNNNTITVPGIKISDGLAYAVDLPFVGDDVVAAIRKELNDHINDNIRHITSAERTFWNNKINCNDTVTGEVLVLNRN